MIHIALPEDATQRRLPFYLAMEEWVARCLPPGEYFFAWAVSPTVIFGRNQDMEAEVDTAYCRAHGIEMYRRKSGGGCVYADGGNLMMSYITDSTDVVATFARYSEQVAGLLRRLGLDAEASGRNDVLVRGRKVSGNAFYHLPGRSIVHGTMLIDPDMEHMRQAITPARAKLESHRVHSAASRITTLGAELPGMTLAAFRDYAIEALTDAERVVTEAELAQIEALEQDYYRPEWIAGRKSPRATMERVDGAGTLGLSVDMGADGTVQAVRMAGDYFMTGDVEQTLFARLIGKPLTAQAVAEALAGVDASQVVPGLRTERLAQMLMRNATND